MTRLATDWPHVESPRAWREWAQEGSMDGKNKLDRPDVETDSAVQVACSIPGGLMIRAAEERRDGVTGASALVPSGVGVRLNGPSALDTGAGATERPDLAPGITEVDESWIRAWLRQNELNPVVVQGRVWIVGEEKKPEENPTET